jgi:dihydrodipicolinate synthase/N-acetylneuraminate lyase
VLVPPPFYYRSAPTAGVADFFLEVLDAAELPVLLYHIPDVTGVPVSDAILDRVVGHRRFGGVKDSSGDPRELERFTGRLDGAVYMVGHDRLLSASVASGEGSITAVASVAPRLVVATHREPGRQGELDRVRELLESYGLGPAVKAILRHRGVGAYRTRPPLLDLDDESACRLVAQFDRLVGS